MKNLKKNYKKGFTLIELLVVIAIIGILATIVLVSLNIARMKARDGRRAADIDQIGLAVEMYYDASNPQLYPGAADWTNAYSLLSVYLVTKPTDPSGGAYPYTWVDNSASGASSTYCVYAQTETQPQGAQYYVSARGGSGKRTSTAAPTLSACTPQ